MKKCVRITCDVPDGYHILESAKRKARYFQVEGIAYREDDEYVMVVHGEKDIVEKFIDAIHAIVIDAGSEDFVVQPHPKEEDYRGVFRVLQS